eukprot:scaffold279738_cov31-Tisochrysis_lutea.AAC.6
MRHKWLGIRQRLLDGKQPLGRASALPSTRRCARRMNERQPSPTTLPRCTWGPRNEVAAATPFRQVILGGSVGTAIAPIVVCGQCANFACNGEHHPFRWRRGNPGGGGQAGRCMHDDAVREIEYQPDRRREVERVGRPCHHYRTVSTTPQIRLCAVPPNPVKEHPSRVHSSGVCPSYPGPWIAVAPESGAHATSRRAARVQPIPLAYSPSSALHPDSCAKPPRRGEMTERYPPSELSKAEKVGSTSLPPETPNLIRRKPPKPPRKSPHDTSSRRYCTAHKEWIPARS